MYMEAGEWDKCLEVAKQQVSSPVPHPSVLRNIASAVVSLKYYLTNYYLIFLCPQSITLSFCALKVLPYLSVPSKYYLIFLCPQSITLSFCALKVLPYLSEVYVALSVCSLQCCLIFLPVPSEILPYLFSCVLRNLLLTSSQIITSSLSLSLCPTLLPFHRGLVY